MDIKKIKQLMKLSKLLGNESSKEKTSSIYDSVINKKVIIRTYSAGVHYGILNKVKDNVVELKNARRIHYWNGANSLTDIALGGISDKATSRITKKLPSIILQNVIEIIECTDVAIEDLDNFPEWTLL